MERIKLPSIFPATPKKQSTQINEGKIKDPPKIFNKMIYDDKKKKIAQIKLVCCLLSS